MFYKTSKYAHALQREGEKNPYLPLPSNHDQNLKDDLIYVPY